MDWSSFWLGPQKLLDTQLFTISGTPITVSTLALLALILIGTVWLASTLRVTTVRILTRKGGHAGNANMVGGLLRYATLVTGVAVAMQTAGVDLTALFAAGALFAVGLGFAMQSIAQNFVAGVILLGERAIKPGDVLEVEGRVVRVRDMGIRATIARTRDGEDLIVPNSILIQSTVKNYTLKDSSYRVRASVGVVYSSDIRLVLDTLDRVASEVSKKWGVTDEAHQVLMTGFGDNSVNFEVALWMSDPWTARPAQSELHQEIWWAFKELRVVIAFPQLDIHFDPSMEAALRHVAPAPA